MTKNTRVKVSVCYDTGSACYRTECVMDKESAEDIISQWNEPSRKLVGFNGRLNDADANEISFTIEREAIKCIDYVEVNNL